MHTYIKSITLLFTALLIILTKSIAYSSTYTLTRSIQGPISAKVIKVLDGDTIQAEAMIWPGQYINTYIRINGIDTPEHRGKCQKEKKLAKKATNFLKEKIKQEEHILLYNIKNGKFAGRVIADIKTAKGENIAQIMLKEKLANNYNGKNRRKSWCKKDDI